MKASGQIRNSGLVTLLIFIKLFSFAFISIFMSLPILFENEAVDKFDLKFPDIFSPDSEHARLSGKTVNYFFAHANFTAQSASVNYRTLKDFSIALEYDSIMIACLNIADKRYTVMYVRK